MDHILVLIKKLVGKLNHPEVVSNWHSKDRKIYSSAVYLDDISDTNQKWTKVESSSCSIWRYIFHLHGQQPYKLHKHFLLKLAASRGDCKFVVALSIFLSKGKLTLPFWFDSLKSFKSLLTIVKACEDQKYAGSCTFLSACSSSY